LSDCARATTGIATNAAAVMWRTNKRCTTDPEETGFTLIHQQKENDARWSRVTNP
jgi:hypothetical protein